MQCGFVLSFLGVFLSAYLIAGQTGKGERGKGSQLQENAKRAVINSFTVPFLLVPLSSGVSEILNLCRVIESCFYDRKGKGRSGRGGDSCER